LSKASRVTEKPDEHTPYHGKNLSSEHAVRLGISSDWTIR
jgi:hypothetical protein